MYCDTDANELRKSGVNFKYIFQYSPNVGIAFIVNYEQTVYCQINTLIYYYKAQNEVEQTENYLCCFDNPMVNNDIRVLVCYGLLFVPMPTLSEFTQRKFEWHIGRYSDMHEGVRANSD